MERTFDYRKVKAILGFNPPLGLDFIYLLDNEINMWACNPFKDGIEIHAEMSRLCRGKDAIRSGKEAVKWIFDNTDFNKIYATISIQRKDACLVASNAGMENIKRSEEQRLFLIERG